MKRLVLSLVVLAACAEKSAAERPWSAGDDRPTTTRTSSAVRAPEEKSFEGVIAPSAAPAPPSMGDGEYNVGVARGGKGGGGVGLGRADAREREMSVRSPAKAKKVADEQDAEPEAPTRSWFPETFLFEPLVVTDAEGKGSLAVKIPDRLTTWRVLALAHTRGGAQAGSVSTFLGTLAVYVDPVLPPFLRAGDEIRLPIQVVNTTAAPVTSPLRVEAEGASVAGAPGQVSVGAGANAVVTATMKTDRPGLAKLLVALGGTDKVVREVEVQPTGRPVVTTRSGTLAAPRTLELSGPASSDPGADRVRLTVFPGALALLRAELNGAVLRGGVANDAYALLLAGRAPSLLAALGDEPDRAALRTMTLLATQRALRYGRTLAVPTAALLAEAAYAHADNPVLGRLGERAATFLAVSQRPDGTYLGETGWTLQRVLVATAEVTRVVQAVAVTPEGKQRAALVRLRASGAFERHLGRVEDAYTAAAILASGAASPRTREKLVPLLTKALVAREDGAKELPAPPDVVRADGWAPTTAEATALAILALEGEKGAPLADLGATLLSSYSPLAGWGDGRANLLCLRAAVALFKDPLPAQVKLVLSVDGQVVAESTLDPQRAKDVAVLEGQLPGGLGGAHRYEVRAEPALPGLGYSLVTTTWTPWTADVAGGGIELQTAGATAGVVGQPLTVTLRALAPAGMNGKIKLALPAGVQPDVPSLQRLVDGGQIFSFDTADGLIELTIRPLSPGQVFAADLRLVPTLAGTLRSGPASLQVSGRTFTIPPQVYTFR